MLALPDVTLCCVDTANHALALRALARSRDRNLLRAHAASSPTGRPTPRSRRRSRSPLISPARFARRLFRLRAEIAAAVRRDVARAARPVGRLRDQPGGVGSRVPRMRLHRREVVLARGRHARGQRRLFAALAPAARSAPGSARSYGSTPRTRRSAAAFGRCSSASTASASAAEERSPTGFRSKPPTRSASRSDSTDSTTSAAPCRRTRSPRFARRFPTRSRARRSSSSCCATAVRSDSGRRRSRSGVESSRRHRRPPRRGALLDAAQRRAAATPAAGRNDPCPCGSGKKFKQCHGSLSTPAARVAPAPADADALARAAFAAHRSGNIDEAERGYRAALAIAPEHPLASHYLGVVLYQRNRLDEAIPLLERSAAAAPAGARVPQQPGAGARGGGPPRRCDRRVSPRARRSSPATRRRGTTWASSCNAALRLPGSHRRVSRSDRAQARLRAGALESLARAA